MQSLPCWKNCGMRNPQLYDEMAADANSVLNAIITILQIHSPSKAVADLFKQVPAGAIEGMSEGEGTFGR